MSQLGQLNQSYEEIVKQGGELLAIHLECSPEGTAKAVEKLKIQYPMANDERLVVAVDYSPTSTYLIGLDGKIKARWLDRIHDRVSGEKILEAMAR